MQPDTTCGPAMSARFETRFHARWADMDFNAHMGNAAYLDAASDVRMQYFASHGFPMAEFARLRVGPVVRRDELEYQRELRLLEPVLATLELGGLSADGARFRMCNEFRREDGQLAARVVSLGGWLDLSARKLCVPPPALAAAMQALARSADFVELPGL
jgi:acyl-CoA thioester hydrolase